MYLMNIYVYTHVPVFLGLPPPLNGHAQWSCSVKKVAQASPPFLWWGGVHGSWFHPGGNGGWGLCFDRPNPLLLFQPGPCKNQYLGCRPRPGSHTFRRGGGAGDDGRQDHIYIYIYIHTHYTLYLHAFESSSVSLDTSSFLFVCQALASTGNSGIRWGLQVGGGAKKGIGFGPRNHW